MLENSGSHWCIDVSIQGKQVHHSLQESRDSMTCAELQQQNASRKSEIARKWVGIRHPGLEKVAYCCTIWLTNSTSCKSP